MAEANDNDLLCQYADRQAEAAFTALVQRHINLVYSVAWRYVGNVSDAQDVTQAVFLLLARKATGLRQRASLTGWLYETTRLTARQLLRTRYRQQLRDQEVFMQSPQNEAETAGVWRQLEPLLEEAMTRLSEKERALLALRYFENHTGAEAAALLGIGEWAAHKRAARALEKLRRFLARRGVNSTASALAGAMSAHSLQVAPATLVQSVAAVALAKGVATGGLILLLVKGAMKAMTWAKLKSTMAMGAVGLITGGLVLAVLAAQKPQPVPTDAVAFFKQAISAPPPIESFIAGRRSLLSFEALAQVDEQITKMQREEGAQPVPENKLERVKKMQRELFYTGARSGSDFYLRGISSPNTPDIPDETFGATIGRAGAVLYQVGKDNVMYGSGTNSFVASVDNSFNSLGEYLNMGLSEIKPESVVWTENQFTAVNRMGHPVFGELELSNSLPLSITLSERKSGSVYGKVEYQYPNPPTLLGGFPFKMKSIQVSKGTNMPLTEITLYAVHIADHPLPHRFFSDDQFKTVKITSTNAYINSEVWGTVYPVKGKPYFTNLSSMKVVYPRDRNKAKQ